MPFAVETRTLPLPVVAAADVFKEDVVMVLGAVVVTTDVGVAAEVTVVGNAVDDAAVIGVVMPAVVGVTSVEACVKIAAPADAASPPAPLVIAGTGGEVSDELMVTCGFKYAAAFCT